MDLLGAYQVLAPPEDAGSLPTTPYTYFSPVQPEQLDRIYALEAASYPEDEAATYEKLQYRIEHASGVFLVALQLQAASAVTQPNDAVTSTGDNGSSAADRQEHLAGFVCGTLTSAGKLTHESMSTHDPDGTLLCIHSVVVESSQRRKGLATRMLKAYLQFVQGSTPALQGVRLLCKEDLVSTPQHATYQHAISRVIFVSACCEHTPVAPLQCTW